jgi:putative Ca2+/H+ antiporter (TMEM165/GDT1 family)
VDWKLALSTFGSILIAELGDKTQIATFSLAAGHASKWAVFLGAALALCISTGIGVAVGTGVSHVISPVWLRRIAGAVFIVMGVVFLTTHEM